jgi:histidyl-tRNA synthetase
MNDILPEQTYAWRYLERAFSACVLSYGYREVRFPILENTQLFKRSIGEVTDIVEKEMYTFIDRNGDSLTLRPEGTAGCVRACLEHGLLHNQQQKLWYMGPMFRHEKPQKGRYRQFTQLGVEAFGISGSSIELEMLAMCKRLWELLGLSDVVTLQINTLGAWSERQLYRDNLVAYLQQHVEQLDEDSQRRLEKNPLRILDSKNPEMQSLINNAPRLMDALGEASKAHFDALCQGLEKLGIAYTINPRLVRGLDYYGHTVFEWVTEHLGSQATVCAGGRFDKLVEQLGGKSVPAVGFALGAERLLLLMNQCAASIIVEPSPMVYVIVDEAHLAHALIVAEMLRQKAPDWVIMVHTSGGSFKNQFKRADKSGARFALILGDDEIQHHKITVKNLRDLNQQQHCVDLSDIHQTICMLAGENRVDLHDGR